MKHSRPLLLLILTASALLLSAATPSLQPSPTPSAKSETKQSNSGSSYAERTPSPSPNGQTLVSVRPALNLQTVTNDHRKQSKEEGQGYRLTDILLTVFNGLLALFTLALVIVGGFQARRLRQTVEITKEAADAAVAASAAHVSVMRVGLENLASLNTDPVPDPILRYGFTNFGKSPGFMTEMCWERCIASRLPEQPIYRNRGPLHELLVIPAEGDLDTSHHWSHVFGDYLTKETFEPIRKMEQKLFVYGYIRYRDVFEQRYCVGFAYYLDSLGRAHVVSPDTAPAYVYRRKE